MTWIRNLSVGRKLGLSFGLVCLLLLALMGVALNGLSSVNSAERNISTNVGPKQQAALTLKFQAADLNGWQNGYVLDGGASRPQFEKSAAGFQHASIETVDHRSKARSAKDVAIAYCQGTPLRNEIVTRDASLLEKATDAATDALTKRFGNGAIDGLIRAHVIAAAA